MRFKCDSICFHCWWCSKSKHTHKTLFSTASYFIFATMIMDIKYILLMGCFIIESVYRQNVCHLSQAQKFSYFPKNLFFLFSSSFAEILFEFVKYVRQKMIKRLMMSMPDFYFYYYLFYYYIFFKKRQFYDVMSICFTCSIYHQHKKYTCMYWERGKTMLTSHKSQVTPCQKLNGGGKNLFNYSNIKSLLVLYGEMTMRQKITCHLPCVP